MRAEAVTDPGLARVENEDAYLLDLEAGFFAVADGMGGHRAGAVASRLAVETIAAGAAGLRDAADLAALVRLANMTVLEQASRNDDEAGMGTTLTAALIREGRAYLAHVGDSRAYLYRDGQLSRLTDDHSLVGEMVRLGALSDEEARRHPSRNVLTRALGTSPEVDIDLREADLQAGDVLLLCTDGLFGLLTDAELAAALALEPALAVRRLLETALSRGAPDNVTAVLVSYD